MNSNNYHYELYRFDKETIGGSIGLYVGPTSIMVEDHTFGPNVEEFFGRYEHDYSVSVSLDDAVTILESLGVDPGKYPTEKLALRFAESHTGNNSAATAFQQLAVSAGIKPTVFDW